MKRSMCWKAQSHRLVANLRARLKWRQLNDDSSRRRKRFLPMTTTAAPPLTRVSNYVNGKWCESSSTDWQDVVNPATGEVLRMFPSPRGPEVPNPVKPQA